MLKALTSNRITAPLTGVVPFVLAALLPCWMIGSNLWGYYNPEEQGCLTVAIMEQYERTLGIIYGSEFLIIAELAVVWARVDWRQRLSLAIALALVSSFLAAAMTHIGLRTFAGISQHWHG